MEASVVNQLAQGHTANEWQSWYLNLGCLTPGSTMATSLSISPSSAVFFASFDLSEDYRLRHHILLLCFYYIFLTFK